MLTFFEYINIPNLWRNQNDDSRKFPCNDCKDKNFKLFMVNDDLWLKYGINEKTLCKKCLEKRIGRKLNKNDFQQYKNDPINNNNSEIKKNAA